jgi:hypothetical protein
MQIAKVYIIHSVRIITLLRLSQGDSSFKNLLGMQPAGLSVKASCISSTLDRCNNPLSFSSLGGRSTWFLDWKRYRGVKSKKLHILFGLIAFFIRYINQTSNPRRMLQKKNYFAILKGLLEMCYVAPNLRSYKFNKKRTKISYLSHIMCIINPI